MAEAKIIEVTTKVSFIARTRDSLAARLYSIERVDCWPPEVVKSDRIPVLMVAEAMLKEFMETDSVIWEK